MSRRALLIGGAIALVAVVGWYFLLYAPIKDDTSSAKDKLELAKNEETSKTNQLTQLRKLKAQSGTAADSTRRLDQLVPASAELASFIDNANTIAIRSGIDWLSIAPTPPSPTVTVGGASVIVMSMQIEGTFYDVLKYLDALADPDQMPRLVVVDSLNIAAKSDSVQFAGQSPTLAVTLSARMFTQPAGSTSTTTPGGTSGSSSSTTGSTTGSTGPTTGAPSPSSIESTTAPASTGAPAPSSNTLTPTPTAPPSSAPSTAIQ
ncbi:MAG: type 4a pilus biogenesis protein PilO [Acidimicrobiia bacterium]